jgi:hypothetical protein
MRTQNYIADVEDKIEELQGSIENFRKGIDEASLSGFTDEDRDKLKKLYLTAKQRQDNLATSLSNLKKYVKSTPMLLKKIDKYRNAKEFLERSEDLLRQLTGMLNNLSHGLYQ